MAEFKEIVNAEMAKYLYNLTLNDYKGLLSKSDIVGTTKMIKSYLSKMINNEYSVNIKYNYSYGKKFGRLFADKGIQGLPKIIRGSLLDGIATDIDIVNAHPNILRYVCGLHNIPCANLSYYVQNRDQILSSLVEETGITREQAKELFLKSTNDCRAIKTTNEFLRDYDKEVKKIQKKLMNIKDYQFILPYSETKERNQQGSFINNVMCYYENLILQDTIEFFNTQKVEILGLFFDGLMVYGNHTQELLMELNVFIFNKWKYDFKFVYKKHETLTIPEDFISKDILKNYETIKNEFNEYMVKVGGMYVNTNNNTIYKLQELKDNFLHIGYDNGDGERKIFINSWTTNITDDMIVYDRFGIYPKHGSCPKNEYNLWTPFTYENLTTDYEKDIVGLNAILNHIDILCNHQKEVYDFNLMWLAQMFQYPQHKSMCIIYKSEQGIGKNTLIELISSMLGENKMFETSKPDKDVWGDFNGKMKDAFLVHLTEIDYKKCSDKSAIFNLITDGSITINEKGKNQYTLNSYHRFIGSTNSDYPIFDSAGGRRFLLIECSDEKKADIEYFTDLRKHIENRVVQRTFYDYLMNYPTKPIISERDIPKTEFHQKIKEASKDTMDSFIEDLVMTNYKKEEVVLTTNEVWELFRLFCVDSNIECKMTKQQFNTRLGMRKLVGISSMVKFLNNTTSRVKVFNIPRLKEYFNITEPEDFVI